MHFNSAILILEDDLLIAEQIKTILAINGMGTVKHATNKADAVEIMLFQDIGLVIADIGLDNDECGIDIVNQLRQIKPTPIIFLTAKNDPHTIEKLKRAKPSAFLSKPFRTHELIANIDIAYQSYALNNTPKETKNQDHLFFPVGKGYKRILKRDILYFEADGSYVKLFTTLTSLVISTNIGHIEKQLCDSDFLRISRKHLVNQTFILGIESNCVNINGKCLPIGESYKSTVSASLPLIRTK